MNGLHDRTTRQQSIGRWVTAAFGAEHAASLPQRGVRLVEEAIEAAQACGSSPEMLHRLIDHVYSRPAGQLQQELGGVGVTTLALASAAGIDADGAEITEVIRVLSKPLEHFRARNEEKNRAGFDAVAPAAPEAVDLLEIARETGLRQQMHGVPPDLARDTLQRFVAAVRMRWGITTPHPAGGEVEGLVEKWRDEARRFVNFSAGAKTAKMAELRDLLAGRAEGRYTCAAELAAALGRKEGGNG